jgi:hypothetical protein
LSGGFQAHAVGGCVPADGRSGGEDKATGMCLGVVAAQACSQGNVGCMAALLPRASDVAHGSPVDGRLQQRHRPGLEAVLVRNWVVQGCLRAVQEKRRVSTVRQHMTKAYSRLLQAWQSTPVWPPEPLVEGLGRCCQQTDPSAAVRWPLLPPLPCPLRGRPPAQACAATGSSCCWVETGVTCVGCLLLWRLAETVRVREGGVGGGGSNAQRGWRGWQQYAGCRGYRSNELRLDHKAACPRQRATLDKGLVTNCQ